jgi:hypothetical protein
VPRSRYALIDFHMHITFAAGMTDSDKVTFTAQPAELPRPWTTRTSLQEARRRVMRRHPRTNFVCLHCADSEDLTYVSECLDSHPNMYVDIAARIGELGRQPRASGKFFDRYQDRIVFGADAISQAHQFSATGIRGKLGRNLLSLPRNGRRVFRLLYRQGSPARPLAHLWTRPG